PFTPLRKPSGSSGPRILFHFLDRNATIRFYRRPHRPDYGNGDVNDMTSEQTTKPLILLTNDDGFFSEGIQDLFHALTPLAEVYIVAPDREQSATSMALTLHSPLRVKHIEDRVFAVSGTPVDCVYMAVQKLLPGKPSLLLSGINPGPNLGQQDISYSGTMGGAQQGTFLGIPSVALSLMHDGEGNFDFDFATRFAARLAAGILVSGLPEGVTVNVNIPPSPVRGIRLAGLGEKRYNPEILVQKDPRDRTYYWIGTGIPRAVGGAGTDVHLIKQGYITITPVHRDLTDNTALETSVFKNLWGLNSDEIIKKTI
ncbi:MAG: 5'/3'-nucleotidase SurE, partial [Candidatus Aminicenantes bacterium]|nr:5'/3'-nucleotidase SurE [Candidatus Aminicenantes bacterium]